MKYVCSKCGAWDCKLWRQYQSFTIHLLCVDCAGKDQGVDVSDVDDKVAIQDTTFIKYHQRTRTIKWLVPAVPVKGEDSYWGYTSVPNEDLDWWYGLPTRQQFIFTAKTSDL